VRLRDEGEKVTLTWKRRLGIKSEDGSKSDDGMEEVEVVVSNFDQTADILRKMGMRDKFYQENRRKCWKKGSVEFDIDLWPLLNPYLEIEAHSWEAIDLAIRELGLDPEKKKIFSTGQIYKMNGINEMEYKKMGFTELIKKPKN
jgi:predicted adenylyl cyclase CyaB